MSDTELPTRKLTNRWLVRITTGRDETTDEVTEYEDLIFDSDRILLSEAMAMEKNFGLTWAQILVGITQTSPTALSAVIWVLHKRKNPSLKPKEEEFNTGDIQLRNPDFMPEHGGIPFGEAAGDIPEIPEDTEPEAPKARAPRKRAAPRGKTPSASGGSPSPK